MENIPGPSNPDRENTFVARIKEDKEGRQWYLDNNRKVVSVDDTAKAEVRRQQVEKAAGREVVPAPGFPEFGTMLGFEEMPVAAGEPAPEGPEQREQEAGGQQEPQNAEEAREQAKARREAARGMLNEKYNNRVAVEGTKGFFWHDPETDKAVLIQGDGDTRELAAGESFNFGDRENPQWKKWGGSEAGWADATEADIRTAQRPEDGRHARGTGKRAKGPQRATPIEGAPGYRSQPEGEVAFHEVGGAVMVKQSNGVRTATVEEIAQYRAGRGAPAQQSAGGLDLGKEIVRVAQDRQLEQGIQDVVGETVRRRDRDVGERQNEAEAVAEQGVREVVNDVVRQRERGNLREDINVHRDEFREDHHPEFNPPPNTEPPEGPPLGPRNAGDIVYETEGRPEGGNEWVGRDPREYIGITPKTIDDILADKRDALGFGETFKQMHPGAKELLLRYHTHTQSQEDMTIMRNVALEYAYRLKLAEDVKAKLTPAELELLSRPRRNQILSDLMAHRRAPRAHEMVHNAVFLLAMENPALVEEIRATFGHLDKWRATRDFKTIEKGVQALSKRNGTRVSEFSTVFDINSRLGRAESRAYLEQRVRESAGNFRKALDWTRNNFGIGLPGSSLSVARGMVSQAQGLNGTPGSRRREVRDAVASNLNFIALHLGAAITRPEWRALIAEEVVTNQNALLERERGPQTFGQMQQSLTVAENTPASIGQRVRERIAANPDYASWGPEQQDNWLRNDVMQDELRRHKEGLGFWAWLFSALLGRNVEQGINAAAGHAVFT